VEYFAVLHLYIWTEKGFKDWVSAKSQLCEWMTRMDSGLSGVFLCLQAFLLTHKTEARWLVGSNLRTYIENNISAAQRC
jgi:hypothetical protein